MKNLYCSFLNFSGSHVSDDFLIYQHQETPGEKPKSEPEFSEGEKKRDAGFLDNVKEKTQEYTQARIDFLTFVALKNEVDRLTYEKKITSGDAIKPIGQKLNELYKVGIDLDDPKLVIKAEDCEWYIHVQTSKEDIHIRANGNEIKIYRQPK